MSPPQEPQGKASGGQFYHPRGGPLNRSFSFLSFSLLSYQTGFGNLIVVLSIPMAAARVNQDGDSVLKAEKQ